MTSGLATLYELQTVYGIEDVYKILDVAIVDAHNRANAVKPKEG